MDMNLSTHELALLIEHSREVHCDFGPGFTRLVGPPFAIECLEVIRDVQDLAAHREFQFETCSDKQEGERILAEPIPMQPKGGEG